MEVSGVRTNPCRRQRVKYFLQGKYSDKSAAAYYENTLKMESLMESRFASHIAMCDGTGRHV